MKNKLIILQIFIVIALICTSVYATLEATISVSVAKSTIYRGDTVEVVLSLEGVDSNKKVTNIEGYINYNKDVIEELTYDSIVKDNDKKVKIGDETLPVEDLTNLSADQMPSSSAYVGFNSSPTSNNDTKIVIDFNDGITKDTELLKIKFKVKSNAKIGDIENAISYSMFVVTAGSESSEEISKNVNLTVKEVVSNNDNTADTNDTVGKQNNTANNTKNTNTNTNRNVNLSANGANTVDNTVSATKLPATGAKILVIPAIILVAIAYISYNRYIRMKGI